MIQVKCGPGALRKIVAPFHARAAMHSHAKPDAAALALLVDRFYEKVRQDAILGPIFNPVVHDWPEHKQRLTAFWSSVVLRTASYRGNPMAVHRALPNVHAGHFQHWLGLWRETARETLDADAAALMLDYAERIGQSLRMGMGLPASTDGLLPMVR